MNHNAPASMWIPLPPRRPATTLTFDLQGHHSSVGTSRHSLCRDCSSSSWDVAFTRFDPISLLWPWPL